MDMTLAAAASYSVIYIRDQGTGMGDEIRSRMYDPYFTHGSQVHPKGLGMSLVFGLIRKCGGHIRCTSALGAGTQFEIFLLAAGETHHAV